MSIDYRANYGIGYKVCEGEGIADTEALEDGLEEYIYCEAGDGFEGFSVGSAFTGVVDGDYLTIKDPLKNGLDLSEAKESLDKEIDRLGLETCGDFGIVGGLYIY